GGEARPGSNSLDLVGEHRHGPGLTAMRRAAVGERPSSAADPHAIARSNPLGPSVEADAEVGLQPAMQLADVPTSLDLDQRRARGVAQHEVDGLTRRDPTLAFM